MKLRCKLITGSVIVAVIALSVWLLFYCEVFSSYQELLVSPGITLTTQWLELKPATPMKTAGDWSELFIEVPGLVPCDEHGFPYEPFRLDDGARFEVEGYLTTDKGEKVYLDEISAGERPGKAYLNMSNKDLDWKKRDYRFRTVTLRSNRVLTIGKVVWVSYDPRTTKDGMAHPDLLE
ncbi:MAG: hypothetical protein ABSG35_11410 [Syntrophobacteraceae bacterium]